MARSGSARIPMVEHSTCASSLGKAMTSPALSWIGSIDPSVSSTQQFPSSNVWK
ncbi:hypothetical protein D3C87_1819600 [compost metagenome]